MNLARTRPMTVQYAHVTIHNVEQVARWCGGQAYDQGTPDAYVAVREPGGHFKYAHPGKYVVLESGSRFHVLSEEEFLAGHEPLVAVPS